MRLATEQARAVVEAANDDDVDMNEVLLRLVQQHALSTQADVADALREHGIDAVQATVSRDIAQLGAVNSLSQTLLKVTAPGVPDIYQGTEIWDYSLVDPDNRRPVDYKRRVEMLESA